MMRILAAVLCSAVVLVTVSACNASRTDLTESDEIEFNTVGSPSSDQGYAEAYFDAASNETVIRGRVYGKRYGRHVHVKVTSPEGQVIADKTPHAMWLTRQKFRSSRAGRFSVRLPEQIPAGSVIDVVFHDHLHGPASNG
jgi:hypothetical protein